VLTAAWTPFRPHPVQRALWATKDTVAIVPAGRGSGKTELAKRRLIRFLPIKKPWPDPRYFYSAPTRDQAKRIAWRSLKKLMPPEWIKDISEGELRIETIFGSELFLFGMDKPQRVEGMQWDGGVVDESSDQRPKAFDLSISPALTHREGWCWRIGVPKRTGVGALEYRKVFESALAGDLPGTGAYTWPSGDILTPKQLKWAQDNLDPKDYREQYDAKFENAGGGIFYAYDHDRNCRPCPYRPELPIVVSSDFNVDPMSWCLGHAIENRIEWFNELFIRDTNTESTLKVLYEKYSDHQGGFEFYGDASGSARRSSASQSDYLQILNHPGFKKLGRSVHYARGNPRIADRFASCNALFCAASGARRMFVDPRCIHMIDDIRQRSYKAGTCEPADSGDIGHMTDAMGYAVYSLHPMQIHIDPDAEAETVIIRKGS